jgi:catechol 2,3-dioxygenase-like lactoylglutathione lyase family enzyme
MFTCNHITIACSDIDRAHEFYIDKLGLTLLNRWPHMISARAGEVRFSISPSDELSKEGNVNVILRTDDIDAAKKELESRGVTLLEDIVEAPNFMRFFTIEDPDHNIIHIGQYLRDPLAIGG